MEIMDLRSYSDLMEPVLHVEAGTRLGGQFVVSYYGCLGKSGKEIPDVPFHCRQLLRCAGIFGGASVGVDSSDIGNVPTGGVEAFDSVGNFPWIYDRVFVVGDQSFDRSVEMDQIGISDLFPPSPSCLDRSCMPRTDIISGYISAGGCCGTVNNEAFDFFHDKKRFK